MIPRRKGDQVNLKDLPASIVASGQAKPAFTYSLKDALRHFEKQSTSPGS